MTENPTLWNSMVAWLGGEVSASTLEAYRRASLSVYDTLENAEAHRERCKAEGKNPWTVAPSTQAELLCVWNAFVLQNLGDQFLDADYATKPATVGYVLPITADQILSFYAQVEGWLNRSQQAHHNPDYKLDLAVPAMLPPWSEVEPCPNAHLHGMLEAMRSLASHAGAALLFLTDTPAPTDAAAIRQLNYIRQLHASASSKARYAEDLHGSDPTQEVHERVEPHIKEAIELFYAVGQLLAMPSLADVHARRPKGPIPSPEPVPEPTSASSSGRLPGPGERGFNRWCLTDPESLPRWKSDPQAQHAIRLLWELDPDPQKTLRIWAEIKEAFNHGALRFAADRHGQKLGHFFCCPWGPIYEVLRPITINGISLTPLQQFYYNVSCEGTGLGQPFVRELVIGQFLPTDRLEYGDPNEPPDH